MTTGRVFRCVLAILALTVMVAAQSPKAGLLTTQELKKAVPDSYFFNGQSAPVQLRNSAGFRNAKGQMFLTAIVDTSGYSADVQQKYTGLVITEGKVTIGDSTLDPGQYAFGTTKEGKFVVMNVAGVDLFSVPVTMDDKLMHPVPLKMVSEGEEYKLYLGKRWIAVRLD